MQKIFFLILIFLLTPFASQARIKHLQASGPLATRSQNPLYLGLLATPMESPLTLDKGELETSLQTTFSNVFEFQPTGNTQLTLDMEIWRHALNVSYGLTDQLDIKIEVAAISNGGGFLDAFVQGYHNALGLPNGGRDQVANGQFTYQVSQGGTVLANYAKSPFGFTDITLRAKYLFLTPDSFPFQIALLPYLKIPTGQAARGLSSGRFDGGLSALAEADLGRHWHFVSQVGGVFLGGHRDLNSILAPGMLTFGQSIEYQLTSGWSLITQLTGNTTAFKNVDADELSSIVLDLNVGMAGTIPLQHKCFKEFYYQASFSEDVLSLGPSVDFSLLFLTGVRF